MRANRFRFTVLGALLVLAAGCLRAQDVAGTWQGAFQAGKSQRIVVKIAKDGGAGWRGVVYNLDSNMASLGRATTAMSLQAGELRFQVASIESGYAGKLSEDGTALAGTWTQSGADYPLTLARVTGDAAWEIPKADVPMAEGADPDWDVVSVKAHDPNDTSNAQRMTTNGRQIIVQNRTVEGLVLFAYGLHKRELVGAPGWLGTERWDAQGVADVPGQPNLKQMQSLIRKLLEERFGLKVHRESKELAVYAITVAKGGEKMDRSTGDPNGSPRENENSSGWQITMRMTNMSMDEFAPDLGYFLDRPAVNQTGLTGRFDFQMKWTADESKAPADDSAPPDLFAAIQQQIGLKLEAVKAAVEVLVVDEVKRASAN